MLVELSYLKKDKYWGPKGVESLKLKYILGKWIKIFFSRSVMYGCIFCLAPPPPTCKITYVNMQVYYVWMQEDYVHMQISLYANLFKKFDFLMVKSLSNADIWHHWYKMQHNHDNMRLNYVDIRYNNGDMQHIFVDMRLNCVNMRLS